MDDSNQRVGVPPYYVVPPQPQDKPEDDQGQGPKVEQQQQQQQDQLQQPQELQKPQWEVSQQQQYNPFGFNFSPQVQPHPEQQQLAGNAPHPAPPHPYMQYPAYYPPTTGYGGHPYGQFPPQQYDAHSQVHHSPPPGSEASPNIQPGQQQLQLGQQQQLQSGQQQPQFQHPQVVQQSFHHSYAPPHQFSAGWVPPGYYPNSFAGGQAHAAGGQSSSPDPYPPGSAPIAQGHLAGSSSSSPAPPLTPFDQVGGRHAPAYPSPPPPPPTLPPPAPAPPLTTEPMIQHSELVPKAKVRGPSAAPVSNEPTMPAAMETTTADDDDVMQDVQGEINIASANDDDDIAPISPATAAAAAAAPASAVQLPQQQDELPPPYVSYDYNSTAPPPPYGPGATDPYFQCSPETARLHKRAVERSNKKKIEKEAGEDDANGSPQEEEVVNIHDVKHTRICVCCRKNRRKGCDRQWPCDNCCKHDQRWNECQYALTDEVASESEGEGGGEGGGVRGGRGGGEMMQGGPPIPAAMNEESENAQAAAASVPEQQQEQHEQPVAAAGPALNVLNVSLTQDQLAQLLAGNPAAAQLLAQMQAVAGGGGE